MASVTIQKRERLSGVKYAVSYYDPLLGRKIYHKTFSRLGDARTEADELKRKLETGKTFRKIDKASKKMTFGEVAKLMKEDWNNQLLNSEIATKTHIDYLNRIVVVSKHFGKMPIISIKEDDIVKYRDDTAKSLTSVTANRSLYVIKRIFKKAIDLRVIQEDPSERVKKLSEKDRMRNRFLKPTELDKLILASHECRGKAYLPALICLSAEHGASKQECLSLKWEDIDLNYNNSGIIRFYRTKNKRERTEYLMPRTKEYLIKWRESQIKNRKRFGIFESGLDLVFSHTDGTPISAFYKAFRKACEIAQITNFHFHDLRHTYCSNLILVGAGLKDVKDMIGHNDIKMTDRYSHLPAEYKSLLQQKLADHYQKDNLKP